MDSNRMEKIINKIKERSRDAGAHDLSHAFRVAGYAKIISGSGKGMVNWEILYAMCLLHDLVRIEGDMEGASVAKSSEEAQKILRECGFLEEESGKILDGIRRHSLVSVGGIKGKFEEPQTLEEKILFDADKLDALGPTGIVRWFISTSAKDMPLDGSAKLYLKIASEFEDAKGGLYTEKGNQLGKQRLGYARKFLQDLLKDLEGKKSD